jgi:ADP-ribose pyrophosphatase
MARGPDAAETRFDGRMIAVTVERWGDARREIVERADSVAIAAVIDDAIVLVRQFREAARRELLELPAGTVDDGEEPLAAAQRELAEETGLRGGRWTPWPTVFTTPGFCRERVHLFLAEDLEEGEASPTDGEAIELVQIPLDDVPDRVGEIEDAKTLAGLLLLLRRR